MYIYVYMHIDSVFGAQVGEPKLPQDLSYDARTLEQRWKDNFAGLRSFVKREGRALA